MEGGETRGRRARAGREKGEKRRGIDASPRTSASSLSLLYPEVSSASDCSPTDEKTIHSSYDMEVPSSGYQVGVRKGGCTNTGGSEHQPRSDRSSYAVTTTPKYQH